MLSNKHMSLAVLAIFRLAVEFSTKAGGDGGKGKVEERVNKSLDGIFKERKTDRKGGRG